MAKKTRKVLELNSNGVWIKVIWKESEQYNKFCVYQCWWDRGEHRKLLFKYRTIQSVLLALATVPQYAIEA